MPNTPQNPYGVKFESVTLSTVNYMNAKKQERAILDQALANKKAELAQEKMEDKKFRREAAKSKYPYNFLARWRLRLNYRKTQHEMRKEKLDKFLESQKDARDEIETSLGNAMKSQTQFKEDYVKAVKENDAKWLNKADIMKTELDTKTQDVQKANADALKKMREEEAAKEERARRSAELQKEIDAREEYENSFYDDAPQKKSIESRFKDAFYSKRQTRGQAERPAPSRSKDNLYKGK